MLPKGTNSRMEPMDIDVLVRLLLLLPLAGAEYIERGDAGAGEGVGGECCHGF